MIENLNPTYVVGVLIAVVYALIEALKHRDLKKNGHAFTDEDRTKLEVLFAQHAPLDTDGRPIWYGNQKVLEVHSRKLESIITVERNILSELRAMNVTLGKWICPMSGKSKEVT